MCAGIHPTAWIVCAWTSLQVSHKSCASYGVGVGEESPTNQSVSPALIVTLFLQEIHMNPLLVLEVRPCLRVLLECREVVTAHSSSRARMN